MRILMVAPQPFFTPRGTPFSVLQRIRAMVQLGHEVELVTYPFGETPEVEGLRIHRTARLPGIRSVPIGPSPAKALLDCPLAATAYRLARSGRYDLIHTHEEAGIVGAWISRRCRLPHLYDMHSSLPEQFSNFDRYDWRPVVWLFRRLEEYTLGRADAVITVCPALRDCVRARGYEGILALIENCYDSDPPPLSDGEVEALRSELDLGEREVVVYTGTLEPYQGLPLLLDAAKRVVDRRPGTRFLVLGGTLEQSQALRSQAEERGVREQFRFIPAVPPEDVSGYLGLATVLVTPRLRGRNTPLKIYQYLRSGKPIVATAIPSHTQVLDASCAELVRPDPETLALGLLTVLEDARRARELVEGAGRLVRRRYSRQDYLDRVSDLLSRLQGMSERKQVA